MADRAKKVSKNHQQASQKSSLSGKAEAKNRARHVNIVHRTTTESLRLESAAAVGGGAGDGSSSLDSVPPPAGTSSVSMLNAAAAAARKPKTSSFQITSVITKGGPPVSRISSASGGGGGADNGDDSADDLDESHAEDSSRVTDTETPSFSEDTFSKEDVFFTTSDAIGSAPVIPTSSQYGLAIVAPAMPGAQNLADVHVSVTDAGINLMTNSKKDVDLKDIHHRNERFKVVKIESTEPFRRGRWICMDYLDHSMVQPTIEEGGEGAAEGIGATTTEGEQQTGDSGAEGIEEGVVEEAVQSTESPGQTLQQPILANEIINNSSSSSTNNGNSSSNSSSSRNQTSTSHAQTIAHIPVSPQQQQQQTGGVPSSTPAMQFPDSNMVHGATLPTALQSTTTPAQQNTQTAPLLPQQLSVSVDQTPMPPQPESMSTFSPQQQVSVPSSAAPSPNPAQQIDSPQAPGAIPNGPIDSPAAVSEDSSITVISAAPAIPAPSDASATSPTAVEMAESAAEPGGATPAVGMGGEASSTNNNATSASASVSAATMASLMSPSTIAAAVAGTVNSSSSNSQGQTILPQSQQQLLQNIVSEDGASTEDSESASGTSAVAIDNKIEQAMDLVKSHLMFAVREEVEVLKERIAELMDRINQLEVENTILKANATQETLSQLTTTSPPKVPPTNPANGPVS